MKWLMIGLIGVLCGCSSGGSGKCGNHLDLYTTDGSRVGTFNNIENVHFYDSTNKIRFSSGGVSFTWAGTYLFYEACE